MKDEKIKKRIMSPRGSGNVRNTGYRRISVRNHPNANKWGTISEHRYVMSKILGRPLLEVEIVHHKNGNRLDNSPQNLELWTRDHPYGQKVSDLLIWAKKIIKTYENSNVQ